MGARAVPCAVFEPNKRFINARILGINKKATRLQSASTKALKAQTAFKSSLARLHPAKAERI